MTVPRITSPCHESWSAMTPNAAGRHCAACDKTVVDVTAMAPAAAHSYLARELPGRIARGERVCVRANADRAGRLLRPGVTRRMLTNGLALMLATASGIAALDGAEEPRPQPPMMGKTAMPHEIPAIEEPVAGIVCMEPGPLDPATDAASGITVRLELESDLLIATDRSGTVRWQVRLAGRCGKPLTLAIDKGMAILTGDQGKLSVDVLTGGTQVRP